MRTKQKGILFSILAFVIAFVFVGGGLFINLSSASADTSTKTAQVGLVKMTDYYSIASVNKTSSIGTQVSNPSGGKIANTSVLKLSTDDNGQIITHHLSNVDRSNKTITGDNNGLLITSTKSGDEAEGTTVMLGTYNGKFDIDFRVFSKNTYEGVYAHRDTTNAKYAPFTDELNPYNDLQELVLRFTEKKENGRSFDVVMYGGMPKWGKGLVDGVMAGVKTDKMDVATGFSIEDIWGIGTKSDGNIGKYDFNGAGIAQHYKTDFNLDKWNEVASDTEAKTVGSFNGTDIATMILGSSFSNSFYTGSSSFQASTQIHFNPAEVSESNADNTAPVVYTVLRGYSGSHYLRAISILNNPNLTGTEGVIDSTAFQGDYTVEAIFSKMTSNDTPVTVNGQTERYDRYANMLIYGINGRKPTAKDVDATFIVNDEIKDSYIEGNVTIPAAKLNLNQDAVVTTTLSKNGGEAVDITSNLTQALRYGKYTIKYSATVGGTTYEHEVPFTVVRTNSVVTNLNDVTVSTGSIAPTENTTTSGQRKAKQYYDGILDIDGDKEGLIVTSTKSGTEAEGSSFMLGSVMQGKFDFEFNVFSEHTYEGNNQSLAWGTSEGQHGRYNHDYNYYNDLQKLIIKFTDIDSGRHFQVEMFGSDVYANKAVSIGVKTDNMPVAISRNTSNSFAADGHYNLNVRNWSFCNSYIANDLKYLPNVHFDPETMEVYVTNVYIEQTRNGTKGNYLNEKVILLDLNNGTDTKDGELYSNWNDAHTTWYGNQIRTMADADGNNAIPSFGRYTVDVIFDEITKNDTAVTQTLFNYTKAQDKVNTLPTVNTLTYDRYAKIALYSLNGQAIGVEDEALVDTTAPAVKANGATYTYGESGKSISVDVAAIEGYAFEYQWYLGEDIISGATTNTFALPALNVGSYDYKCVVTAKDTILDVVCGSTTANVPVIVNKKALTITANAKAITYGDIATNAGVVYNGFIDGEDESDLGGELAYSYTYNQFGNIGDYLINVSGLSAANYEISYVAGALTVNAKAITVTIDDKTSAYGSIVALSATDNGIVNGDEVYTLATTATATSNVGTYEITGTATNANYNVTFVDGEYVITKKAITVTIDDKTSARGAALVALSATDDGIVNGDEVYTLATTATATSNAGVYAITGTATNDNYNVTFVDGEYVITKTVLTITAPSVAITYGDALVLDVNQIQIEGFIAGENAKGALTGAPALACEYEQFDGVGTYAITASGLSAANYEITYVAGTLTVNAKAITVTIDDKTSVYGASIVALSATDNGIVNGDEVYTLATTALPTIGVGTYEITGTATNDNYNVTFVDGEYTITKAAVTITALDKTITYGDALELTLDDLTIEGLIAGDNVRNAFSAFPSLACEYEQFDGVGTYAITASGAEANNYEIAYVAGTLTVNAKAITVTIDDKTSVYGASIVALSATDNGIVNGDEVYTLATTANPMIGVGTYAITGTATNANYNVTFVDGEYTITKAAVTITALDKTITYGDVLELTLDDLTIEGLIAGDNVRTAFSAFPSLTCEYEQFDGVGTYAITASGAEANNYEITYVAGTLTVNAKAITVTIDDKTSVYGASIVALSATDNGIVNGDEVYTLATTANPMLGVGTYAITGTATNDNYNVTFVDGEYTITKAAVTITALDKTITYGDVLELTLDDLTIEGLIAGDNARNAFSAFPSLACEYEQFDGVGTYAITASGAAANNYEITYVAGTLTVNAKAITVTIDDKTSVYGASIVALSATDNGIVNGDTVYTLATTATATSNVGTYEITGTATNANYNVTFVDGEYVITKATVDMSAITFADKTVTYNGEAQSIVIGGTLPTGVTVTYTGNEQTEVGTYTITATFTVADTTNYNAIASKTATLTIEEVPAPAPAPSTGCGASEIATVLGLLSSLIAIAFIGKKN